MEPLLQEFWTPKYGNSPDEYEDASAFSLYEGRFCISDGATESSYADRWAKSLVDQYIQSPPPLDAASLVQWLDPLQKTWSAGIDWDNLPWFAEEKARKGAFASFLGLSFLDVEKPRRKTLLERALFFRKSGPPPHRWQAVAVGDSCLFQVRDGQMIKAFPLTRPEEFNSRPRLLSSNTEYNGGMAADMRVETGECQPGDLFFLATDAFAKWFMETAQAGSKPWEQLLQLESQDEFHKLVTTLRDGKLLKNDDTTVLIFSWHPPRTVRSGKTLHITKAS